jgi:hypothetical protein
MRTARWVPKAIDTHSEILIYIVFPLQQWLHERASMLRYKYVYCLRSIYWVGPPVRTAPTPRSRGLTGPHFTSISKRSSLLVDSVTVDWLMKWWLTITSPRLGACRSGKYYQKTLLVYCCVLYGKQMHVSQPLRKKKLYILRSVLYI